VRYLALLVVLLVGACAPATAPRALAPLPLDPDGATVLCISNLTVADGPLRARAGTASFYVESGRRVCKRLDGTGHAGVTGSTIGGGAMGPVRIRDAVPLDGRCWSWTVRNGAIGFPVPCEADRGSR
jgi:hypothetical protein